MRRPLSGRNPVFYFCAVKLRRLARYFQWWFGRQKFSAAVSGDSLGYRVYKHQSVLVRRLGDSDLTLQYNKVENLKIAVEKLNGILIRPGETFSFFRLVGRPTKKKGYLDGMMLSNGEATAGTGGGICQIANLIRWLCLHSPLTISEHHHHSFDPFPDDGRVVPFGSGASVFYNYYDLQLKNDTDRTYQFLFWLDSKCINGDLRIDRELPYKYHVYEKNHRFIQKNGEFFRQNELWRDKYLKKDSGDIIGTELIRENNCLVKYTPAEYVTADTI
ncbi:MAG: VanW family protein [Oscillospiraceae bacterium]|nr:VanW family protein [Oscillospiraceae bacterium]